MGYSLFMGTQGRRYRSSFGEEENGEIETFCAWPEQVGKGQNKPQRPITSTATHGLGLTPGGLFMGTQGRPSAPQLFW